MTIFNSRLSSWLAVTASVVMLSAASFAAADDKSRAGGKNDGAGNASDGIQGRIVTEKHVIYTGDPLKISLRFARGAQLVTSGEVDASIIIFTPEQAAEPIVVPVSSEASATARRLFQIESVDVSTLPAGQYQIGLVLTVPDGDPLLLSDWHNGLLGMIDVVGIRISDKAIDDDQDGDGMLDDDADDDGFSDDDEEDDSSSGTSTSTTSTATSTATSTTTTSGASS